MKVVCIKSVPGVFTRSKEYTYNFDTNNNYCVEGDDKKTYRFLKNFDKYFFAIPVKPKYDGVRFTPIFIDHVGLIKPYSTHYMSDQQKEQIDSISEWMNQWIELLKKEREKQKIEQKRKDENSQTKFIGDILIHQGNTNENSGCIEIVYSNGRIYPKEVLEKAIQEYVNKINSQKAMEEWIEVRKELKEIYKQSNELNYKLEKLLQKSKNILKIWVY